MRDEIRDQARAAEAPGIGFVMLRMPLHADDVAVSRRSHGLDAAIRLDTRLNGQPIAKRSDGLSVRGTDVAARDTVKAFEVAPRLQRDRMRVSELLHEMGKRNAKKGIATLCIGGGMGVALCVERN